MAEQSEERIGNEQRKGFLSMNSNGTKSSASALTLVAMVIGILAWAVSFFGFFSFSHSRGTYVIFLIISLVILAIYWKIRGDLKRAELSPVKSLTITLICLLVQIIFFAAMVFVPEEVLEKGISLILCMTAPYLICPYFVHTGGKKAGL